ncbi:MAG: MarR family transcriptional regulator [Silicimonas sp.]|nr:MarR family transcriptional regulator [Silicimonas sp.]
MSTIETMTQTDTDLALLIDRFMRRIHAGLQLTAPGHDPENVGPGGGIVLLTLAETGEIGLHELTQRVARDKSQMTRMIRSLEGKGLVTRRPCPADGRVSRIQLTDRGRNAVDGLAVALAETIGGILSAASESDRAALHRILARVLG